MKFGQVEQLDGIDFDFASISSETKQVLQTFKKKPLQFYFGGPGFSDKQYKGVLYPQNTP